MVNIVNCDSSSNTSISYSSQARLNGKCDKFFRARDGANYSKVVEITWYNPNNCEITSPPKAEDRLTQIGEVQRRVLYPQEGGSFKQTLYHYIDESSGAEFLQKRNDSWFRWKESDKKWKLLGGVFERNLETVFKKSLSPSGDTHVYIDKPQESHQQAAASQRSVRPPRNTHLHDAVFEKIDQDDVPSKGYWEKCALRKEGYFKRKFPAFCKNNQDLIAPVLLGTKLPLSLTQLEILQNLSLKEVIDDQMEEIKGISLKFYEDNKALIEQALLNKIAIPDLSYIKDPTVTLITRRLNQMLSENLASYKDGKAYFKGLFLEFYKDNKAFVKRILRGIKPPPRSKHIEALQKAYLGNVIFQQMEEIRDLYPYFYKTYRKEIKDFLYSKTPNYSKFNKFALNAEVCDLMENRRQRNSTLRQIMA